ncbi:MAG: carboxypeptidase regulatory-like domain-containing protein [Acidobacteria bacterium]|nr:carboxypeptidase regulatory-like domain-containing protein [Acidobacteriota bacterium]
MPGISQETYFFSVSGLPPGFYLKSARIGGEEFVESGIALPAKAGGTVELVMSANGGRIEGSVLDAENLPAAAVTVVLVPSQKRRSNPTFYKTATSDAQGKFNMSAIPPGDYKLFAWDDVDTGAWQDPEFIAPFEARGVSVTIGEGTALVTDVKLLINK